MSNYYNLQSISEAHRLFGLPAPKHPLISIIRSDAYPVDFEQANNPHVLSFYKISYRTNLGRHLKYGQGTYDFEEGGLLCAAPNQLIGKCKVESTVAEEPPLYTLLIHPDFLWNYPLAKKIKQYGFFSYSANEALHLSEGEKATVISLFNMIDQELSSRIDDFSHDIVIAQTELLLNFINRFYKRQFVTRKAVSNDLLQNLDDVLNDYFNDETALQQGLPTVQYLAEKTHLSASYLSDMLRSLIGQNAQQYIHSKLIEKAKEKLSTTSLSVSEVAYELGFEHPQSFSKLFKLKTNLSPVAFRRSFN